MFQTPTIPPRYYPPAQGTFEDMPYVSTEPNALFRTNKTENKMIIIDFESIETNTCTSSSCTSAGRDTWTHDAKARGVFRNPLQVLSL
ncbi:hypothetical protein PAPYR_11764 [Paratrimastix pyriformis]|uniref:Uncharacterized protein n=1 Tax=Paratrimastix pyriformis TaxID=342808 RepID=A0ABQ8U329_9EUKA|nr:hypothetical protein PAPYR_11764 [Paratrimastix pyriformis]